MYSQFIIGIVAFFIGLLASAMTFPTPPIFDLALIGSTRPALIVLALGLGIMALLPVPWTGHATGRARWMAVASVVFGMLALALGWEIYSLTGI